MNNLVSIYHGGTVERDRYGYVEFVEMQSVGVSDQGVLNQLVNMNCVPLIPDGDAKRHKVYTGSGNQCPTSSLRDRSCIPCTEVLIVGGYKLGERGNRSQVSAWSGASCLRRCSQAARKSVCLREPISVSS